MSSPVTMIEPETGLSMLRVSTRPAASGKADPLRSSTMDERGLDEACAEFESLFIYQLLKEMRASIPTDGYLGESIQSETYTSMFDIEIAREISSRRGIGLADFFKRQLLSRFGDTESSQLHKAIVFY